MNYDHYYNSLIQVFHTDSLISILPQREVVPSTRLAAMPPAFGIRTLPAQATEHAFAYIQVPQDVSGPADARVSSTSSVSFIVAFQS